MVALNSKNYFDADIANRGLEGQVIPYLYAMNEFIRQGVGGAATAALEISAGSVDPAVASIAVSPEGGGGTGDLTHLGQSHIQDGGWVQILLADPAHTVTVHHLETAGAGRLDLLRATNLRLTGKAVIWFQRIGDKWQERFNTLDVALPGKAYVPCTDTGTADAAVLAGSPTQTNYVDRQLYLVRFAAANLTGAPVADLNGLGNRTITLPGGGQVPVGAIQADSDVLLSYNFTDTRLELLTPAAREATGGVDPVTRDIAVAAFINTFLTSVAGQHGPVIWDGFTKDTLATRTNASYDADGDFYSNDGTGPLVTLGTDSADDFSNISVSGGQFAVCFFENNAPGKFIEATFWIYLNYTGTIDAWIYTVNEGKPDALVATATQLVLSGATGAQTVTFPAPVTGSAATSYALVIRPGRAVNIITVAAGAVDGMGAGRGATLTAVTGNGNDVGRDTKFQIARRTPGGSNMVLKPQAHGITADPGNVSAWILAEELPGADAENNIRFRFSIDGGSTFTDAAAADGAYPFGTSTLLRYDIDLSDQSGASAVWEITSLAREAFNIRGIGYVPIHT